MQLQWFSLIALSVAATATSFSARAVHSQPWMVVAQLRDNNTFLENLAFRPNGDMVVSQNINSPGFYTIQKPWVENAKLELLHKFEDADGALGIVQVAPDHFVVATSKWNGIAPIAESETIQYIKLKADGSVAETGFVGRYPKAGLLNGAVPLGDCHSSILVADSVLGVVYKINPFTGAQIVAANVTEMKATDPNAALQLGVNGIKIRDNHLYWSNSNTISIYRVPITKQGFLVEGAKVETVAHFSQIQIIDDFTIDAKGNLYVVAMFDNEILIARPNGTIAVAFGSPRELAVAGPTALAFGVTEHDSHIMYCTTNGGMVSPVNGTVIEPGKVLAIDITRL